MFGSSFNNNFSSPSPLLPQPQHLLNNFNQNPHYGPTAQNTAGLMPPHQSHLYSRNGHTIWPNPPPLNNYQHLPHQLHPWMYPQTAHQMSQQQQLPPPQVRKKMSVLRNSGTLVKIISKLVLKQIFDLFSTKIHEFRSSLYLNYYTKK